MNITNIHYLIYISLEIPLYQSFKYRQEKITKNTLPHKRINPEIELELHKLELKKGSMSELFSNVDVIIEALDDAKIKTEFIEEILLTLPNKSIVSASVVTGYGNSDRLETKKLGKLYLCYDAKALSSEDDMLYAPRVCLIANWEANLAIEILLDESQ